MLLIWCIIHTWLVETPWSLPKLDMQFVDAQSRLCPVLSAAMQGKLYPDSMYVEDASFDVPYTYIEVQCSCGAASCAAHCVAGHLLHA
jgi:hypothetical protein